MKKYFKILAIAVLFLALLFAVSCCFMPQMISNIEPLPQSEPQVETPSLPPASEKPEPPVTSFQEGINPTEIYFNISNLVHIGQETDKIKLITTIPASYSRRQKVLDIQYFPHPSREFTQNNTRYAEFIIENPQNDLTINITSRMVLYDYDLEAASQNPANSNQIISNKYLEEEKYIQAKHPLIADNPQVNSPGGKTMDKVRNLYQYVLDNLTYDRYNSHSLGAVQALKTGKGDCTEYADSLIALCRASGFPARFIEGYYLHAPDLKNGHDWVEIYLEDYGWVPFDPTLDDGNGSSSLTTFSNLQNAYVYLSFNRNDAVLNDYHFFYYRYWGQEVEISRDISFVPAE